MPLRYLACTDLLKLANVNMRMVQYLEFLTQFGRAGPNPADREAISVYELAHATYGWKRQLGLHHGLYVGEAAGGRGRGGR